MEIVAVIFYHVYMHANPIVHVHVYQAAVFGIYCNIDYLFT